MKALLFDVFGTCVDWRGSVERELARRGLPWDAILGAEIAHACGLRTAFVPRPTEDTEATADWDIVASDFLGPGIAMRRLIARRPGARRGDLFHPLVRYQRPKPQFIVVSRG